MKNPVDVLRSKEQELAQVKREIDALRVALRLLSEEDLPDLTMADAGAALARRVVQLP